MSNFNLSSTKLDEIQNHDDFIVVWLGPKSEKCANFGDYIKNYETYETAIGYIKNIRSERKVLLVLADFFDHVSSFNDCHQIQSIYILNKKFSTINDKHSKLVDIFTDEHSAIDRLRQDILLTYRCDLPISVSCLQEVTTERSLMCLRENSLMFLWNQLFIHYLVHSPAKTMSELKEDMIKQCQLEYEDNKITLDKINEFANDFTPDNALRWYTQDCFVYRVLNRAFRTQNIDFMCKFQYFIIHLYNQLKSLYEEQSIESRRIVYRGQQMHRKELQILIENEGNLISMNTILSTTRNLDVAQVNIAGAPLGVMFEITIDNVSNNKLKPFADISQLSVFPDEQEVLFFIGSVFRIDSVTKQNDSTWYIKLTLNNEIDKHMRHLTKNFENELMNVAQKHHLFMKEDDLIMTIRYYKMFTRRQFQLKDINMNMISQLSGYLYSNIGFYEKAIELYSTLLQGEQVINRPEFFIIFNIMIGYHYFKLSHYDEAFLYYGIALSLLDDDNLLAGELYNNIGDAWLALDKIDIALSCYANAMNILWKPEVLNGDLYNAQDYIHLAGIIEKLSVVREKCGDLEGANANREQAAEIYEQYTPQSDADENRLRRCQEEFKTKVNLTLLERAGLLYSIGLCLIRKGEYTQALDNLLEASKIFNENRPSVDNYVPKISTLYENIALAYLYLKDYLKALIMWKKAIYIRLSIHRDRF